MSIRNVVNLVTTALVNRREAAAILKVSPQTLACWASTGRYRLPFVRVGRRIMYRIEDLNAFIEANLVIREAA